MIRKTLRRLSERNRPRRGVRAEYLEAERLYREGRFEDAIAVYRRIHLADPRFRIARLRLGGLIAHMGTLAKNDDPELAMRQYREAFDIAPDIPKVRGRYASLLSHEIMRAESEGDSQRTNILIAEAQSTGFRQKPPEARRRRTRIYKTLPLQFHPLRKASAGGSPVAQDPRFTTYKHTADAATESLLVPDDPPPTPLEQCPDASPEVLPAADDPPPTQPNDLDATQPRGSSVVEDPLYVELKALREAELEGLRVAIVVEDKSSILEVVRAFNDMSYLTFLTERRQVRPTTTGPIFQAIGATGDAGLARDHYIADWTNRISRSLLIQLKERVPKSEFVMDGIDLLDHLSFELDDLAFRQGRTATLLVDILITDNFDRVVYVTSHGALLQATAQAVGTALGAQNVFWLRPPDPSSSNRVQVLSNHNVPPVDHSIRAPQQDPRWPYLQYVRDRGRTLRKAMAHHSGVSETIPSTPPGSALFLATASTLHADNLARIAERLVDRLPVTILPIAGNAAQHTAYTPLLRLSDNYPEHVTVLNNPIRNLPAGVRPNPRLVRRIRRPYEAVDAGEQGIDLLPLMVSSLESLATVRLPRLRGIATHIHSYIRDSPPSVLVVSPDRTASARVAATLCRRYGVPSIFPQVVFFSDSPRYKPLQADYVTVVDQFTKDLFINVFGAQPDQVLMTGIARFDDTKLTPLTEGRDGHVVLILQRFSAAFNDHFIRLVASSIKDIPGSFLTVKMHPGEPVMNESSYKEIAQSVLGERATVQREALYELISAASVVVSVFSNVVLECGLMNRPVLCVNLTGAPMPIPFVDQGLAIGAENETEVKHKLREMLAKEALLDEAHGGQEAFFRKQPHLRSGPAAVQIADRIVEISMVSAGAQVIQSVHHLLITGEQRSGTTLLAKLLDAQPRVRVERDFAHIDRYMERSDVTSITTPLSREQRRGILSSSTRETLEGLGYTLSWDVDGFSTVLDYYRGLLERITGPQHELVGHKSTRCYNCLEELMTALPDLKVIFLMRDPRDVVPSEMHRARNKDLKMPISRWREGAERWWSLQNHEDLKDRTVMVRFEDLATEPARTLQGVARFLGLGRVDHTLPLLERDQPWQANSSFNDNLEGISETPVERWRNGDSEVTKQVEGALAEPMQRMGYSLSTW